MDISFNTTEPGQIQDGTKPPASLIGWKKNTGEKGPAYSNSKQQIFHCRYFLNPFSSNLSSKVLHSYYQWFIINYSFYSDIFICLLNQTPHLRGYVWLSYLSLYVCYCQTPNLRYSMAALPIFICLLHQTPHLRYSMAVLPIFMCLLSSYTIHSYTSSDRHIVSYFLHKSAIIWSSSREKT